VQSFSDLGVSRPLADALAARGISQPFAVQALVYTALKRSGLDAGGRTAPSRNRGSHRSGARRRRASAAPAR
jgi:hypothetical protein